MKQWYRHVCSGGCPSILTWDVFKLIQNFYINLQIVRELVHVKSVLVYYRIVHFHCYKAGYYSSVLGIAAKPICKSF